MSQMSKSARAAHTEYSISQTDWLHRTLDGYNIEELGWSDLARFAPKLVLEQYRSDWSATGDQD